MCTLARASRNSEVNLAGDLAVMGWKIDQGTFDGVNLDGLSVMGVIHASGTLGDPTETVCPVKSVLVIDVRARRAQARAQSLCAEAFVGTFQLAD